MSDLALILAPEIQNSGRPQFKIRYQRLRGRASTMNLAAPHLLSRAASLLTGLPLALADGMLPVS
jgi:hypothetical protein